MPSILEQLPSLMLYLIVGGGLAVIAWSIWRRIAPAAQGLSLGYYEILGSYAGGKLVKRIKGTLVEATHSFMNPTIETKFKEILVDEMKRRNVAVTDEEQEKILKLDLSKLCRVIVTRAGEWRRKHVIMQIKYVDKSLSEYAKHEPENKFTLGTGFLSKGVITGELHTLSQSWNVPKLGLVTVHFLIPDVPKGEAETQVPEWLAKIALFAPASVELNELIKSKDEQLKDKDRKLSDMGKDLSAMSTELDGMRRALKAFTTTGELPKFLPKAFDIVDMVAMGLPTLVGYYIAEQVSGYPVVGVFVGLMLGALIVYRRR
jgi:hypothetical protein